VGCEPPRAGAIPHDPPTRPPGTTASVGPSPSGSASSSPSGGQTGQSGTQGPCAPIDPFEGRYAFDEPSELGFSGADAMDALAPVFAAAVAWSDGAQAALAGRFSVDPDEPEPEVVERAEVSRAGYCVRILELPGVVSLTTDDGRLALLDEPSALWLSEP